MSASSPMGPRQLTLPVAGVRLDGLLVVPAAAAGLVLFAHGSGSSRLSGRNQAVAAALQRAGLATLLFDLLSPEEERIDRQDASLRFAIPLLAERVVAAIDWAEAEPALAALPIGLFGASTGAAAALIAAAARPDRVRAVVSRGGRPDLAAAALGQVRCPTLLLVGGRDAEVLQLNARAAERLAAPHQLTVIPGAGHLFEQPGSLERVAAEAAAWFRRNLVRANPGRPNLGERRPGATP